MTIRNDLSVNWDASPRIITVNSPSVEIAMQDLLDTMRLMEASSVAMDDASIIDAAGKENLGGGVKVGLTITLLNATLAFETRSGPSYTQCNISGGNLVAIDDIGDNISPIYPTAFTQIVLANSSSATLQEQSALQYASFNGGVTIDVTSLYSGTDYPIGTPQEPVNNIDDAHLIAIERGFPTFFIIGNLSLTEVEPDLIRHSFIGSGKDRTLIDIAPLAIVTDCAYYDAHVTGTLDGKSRLKDCVIDDLIYVKGYIEECVLSPGVITLAGSEEAHFLDCWSGQPGTGTPTIDMGGTGQALALRRYAGGIALINKTGPEAVSIDLNSGQIKLDMVTVTNGTIVCRGVGKLTELTTGDPIESGVYGNLTIVNELIGENVRDLHMAHFNKRTWNKLNDTITIYEEDGITPKFVFDTNDDMSDITPQ